MSDELLPILPLRDVVVFPESMTPLAVGQERSIRLVDEAVAGDRTIALVTSRNSEGEAQSTEDLYEVGTSAVIHKMIRVPDGTLRVLVQGQSRIRLTSVEQTEPYLAGRFEDLPDVVGRDKETEALARNVEALFGRIISLVPYLPEELELAAANAESPSALANLIAATLRLKTAEKQELLAEPDVEARLRRLTVVLNRELEMFELGTKIQSQVQSEMESSQREYFLRQQLKAIQEELGEGDEQQAEVAELRAQIEEAHLPEEADKQARRELDRLTKLPPAAAEYGVRRTYLGAMPGTIVRALRDADSKNPVFMIDEIDKMGADWRGDPSSAMLEVLDPAQNSSFRDHYLDLPFDLSQVLFICTANQLEPIPPPLRDRMEIIGLAGYTEDEKLGIAKRYLVPKQLEAHGLEKAQLTFTEKALRLVIREYTREAGVRELDRQIAALCRKAAREIAESKRQRARVDERRVRTWLGRRRVPP